MFLVFVFLLWRTDSPLSMNEVKKKGRGCMFSLFFFIYRYLLKFLFLENDSVKVQCIFVWRYQHPRSQAPSVFFRVSYSVFLIFPSMYYFRRFYYVIVSSFWSWCEYFLIFHVCRHWYSLTFRLVIICRQVRFLSFTINCFQSGSFELAITLVYFYFLKYMLMHIWMLFLYAWYKYLRLF